MAYEDKTREELQQLAADEGIVGRSTMTKDELIAALSEIIDEPVAEPEPEPEQVESELEPELTAEQIEQLGAGRNEDRDRTERESAPVSMEPGIDVDDTPSALAVAAVGNLDGEDIDFSNPEEVQSAIERAEEYAAVKRQHRWG
jgi:hypothetical protein